MYFTSSSIVRIVQIKEGWTFFDENLAEHSDDRTGTVFQQLESINFIKINISCRLWARAAPDTSAVSSGCRK